ncbi:zincin-like metallopeptidase domain-containing protein [uncultured Parasphingorhabdus sp.]|uniref:ArdC family protein n=1 Tax=uncultured Parasphingorhabdus sp. TaxID=2709694 RepID=UPI0030D7EFAC
MYKKKATNRRHSRQNAVSPAQRITAAIIEKLEAGTRPWVQPWRGIPLSRPLRSCGTPYRGMNVFWLWMVAESAGFCSPYWMTYRQCAKLGGQVRNGEKSTIAIFYKSYTKEVEAADHSEVQEEARRVLKSYAIFNADQCDGLPERYYPKAELLEIEPEGRAENLDQFFARIGANIREYGSSAYYEPLADRITMPPRSLFDDQNQFFATLAHEATHWTGHKSRLNRNLKNRFGSAAYAAEELVAELSSAILGAELGLPVSHLDNHASYISHWLKLLKSDDRAMLTAAARAEEAASLLLRLGGKEQMSAQDSDAAFAEAA